MLFISPKFNAKSDVELIIGAARTKGIKTCTLLNSWDSHKSVYSPNEPCALYGEHAFCEFAAQELRLNLYQNSLDWIVKLPHALVKRTIRHTTIGAAMKLDKTLHHILGKQFIEPANDACFPAAIYTDHFPAVPNETPILLSNYHKWTVKYRFIIANGNVTTACCYYLASAGIFNKPTIWGMNYTGTETNASAFDFIQQVLTHINVAPGCVIDVGYVEHEGWAVCGTYPIWSAELYGCDPKGFLEALFAACKPMK